MQVCCQELSSAGLAPEAFEALALGICLLIANAEHQWTGDQTRPARRIATNCICRLQGYSKCLLYDRLIHRGYHGAPGPAVDLCDLLGA